jgi:hypothetical protein
MNLRTPGDDRELKQRTAAFGRFRGQLVVGLEAVGADDLFARLLPRTSLRGLP